MKNVNIKSYNTFGLDVIADTFLEYESEQDLLNLISQGCLQGKLLHVGQGSNLLFMNSVFHGIVLHSRIKGFELLDETADSVELRVGAGEIWDDFVAYTVEHGWYGAENLSLIPGEVGASAVQNIGAYGAEAKDIITKVETISLDGEKTIFDVKDCQYAYRDSIFKRPEMKRFFVTHVCFRLSKIEHYNTGYGALQQELAKHDEVNLATIRQVIIAIRQSKLPDPKVLGNAGSFFKNPVVSTAMFESLIASYPQMPHYIINEREVKIPAGWLIERTGWKGKSLGKAAVHDKQALVLVNKGGATGQDIVALSKAVCADVQNKFGIDIHPEVNFID